MHAIKWAVIATRLASSAHTESSPFERQCASGSSACSCGSPQNGGTLRLHPGCGGHSLRWSRCPLAGPPHTRRSPCSHGSAALCSCCGPAGHAPPHCTAAHPHQRQLECSSCHLTFPPAAPWDHSLISSQQSVLMRWPSLPASQIFAT